MKKNFTKYLLLTTILIFIVGIVFWYLLIHKQISVSKEEIQNEFGKELLTEEENELLGYLIDYLGTNNKDSSVAVITDNKFKFRLIFHKLVQSGLYLRFKNKPDSSDAKLEIAMEIARVYENSLGDGFLKREFDFCTALKNKQLYRKLEVDYLYNKGQHLLYDLGQDSLYAFARDYYEKSLKLSKKIDDARREVDNLLNIQYFLYNRGSQEEALLLANRILTLVRRIDYRYQEGWALFSLSTTLFRFGEYKEALTNLEIGLKIAKYLDYQKCVMAILERICVASRRLGEFPKALNANTEAMRISQKLGNKSDQVKFYINFGLIYQNMGDYMRAQENFESAYMLAHDICDFNESTALENLSKLYRILGDYEKALKFNSLAMDLNYKTQNYFLIARSKKNRGNVFKDQKDYKKALTCYQQAIEIIDANTKEIEPRRLVSEIWLNIGDIQKEQNKWKLANVSYQKALNTFRDIEVPEGIVNTLIRMGHTLRETGYFKQSLENFKEAIELAEKIEEPTLLWNALYGIGLTYRDQGEFVSAEKAFTKAIDIVEETRKRILGDEEKISYFATNQNLYDEMISLCYEQGKYESAFSFSERSRARAFFDLFHGKPEVFLNDYIPLDKNKNLNILNPISGTLPTLTEIQSALDDNIILIEYKIINERLIIFIVDKESIKVRTSILSQQSLYDLIFEFRKTIGAESDSEFKKRINKNSREVYHRSLELAKKLYSFTIKPIKDIISPQKVLYIIPDDALFYLPFAALVSIQKGYERFFIQDFTIAYAPSASILKYCLDHRKSEIPPNQMKLLAVGNPTGDLASSAEEARNIANLFSNPEILIGETVTEESVLKALARDFNIIHFATHAVIEEKSPLYSYLVLGEEKYRINDTTVARGLEREYRGDDLLMTHEIFNIKLPVARLVTLSTCYSAGGRFFRGEGVVGMNRAFMKAGTSSIIASLWKIDDKYTEKIMTEFYSQWINNKISIVQALREAQLKLITDITEDAVTKYPHPYFWAAFTITGEYR